MVTSEAACAIKPDWVSYEGVWQAKFYASVGETIPLQYVLCNEYFTNPDSAKVEFVLRHGSTRAIKFLIKSSDVMGHHQILDLRVG